jgi:spoIIIJ-associated protein
MANAGGIEAEGTGETVGEARWAALRELERRVPNLDRDAVEYDVLSEGTRGLMGLGREPARVVARAATAAPLPKPPPPHEPGREVGDEAARVGEIVARIAASIAEGFEVRLAEDDQHIVATVTGPSAGLLIGRHGHTIDAVQHLVSAIVFPTPEGRRDVVVDAAGYRARRERTLRDVAQRAADDAVSQGVAMELDPMSAAERKIIHLALAEREDVETSSEGREPARFVVISPAVADVADAGDDAV